MRGRSGVLVGGLLAVAAAVLGIGSPAVAATDVVLLSRDGVHYSSSLAGGLLDGAAALVPGGSVSVDLWVKNPAVTPASVRVSVRGLDASSSAFANGVVLRVVSSMALVQAPAETLANVHRCDVLASAPAIAAGNAIRLTFTFTMDDLADRIAQTDRAALDLLVSIRDAAAGPFAPSACDDDGVLIASGSGHYTAVAYTGTDLPVPLIIGAGLMVGLGVLLVGRRRRRPDRD